jgi:predicted RNA binding protein YcfA (HicA-like mRNA interferase family)
LKLPRDLSGADFVKLLRRYGYEVTRQAGSHIRLVSNVRGVQHHITIPAHKNITIGTLAGILTDVAHYLQMSRSDLERELFES